MLPNQASADSTPQSDGQFLDLENAIRHSLKAFGVRLSKVGRGAFEEAVRTVVAEDPLSSELMDAMLSVGAALWQEYCRLHDLVMKTVARSELCRHFMALPGSWRSPASAR